MPPFKRVEYKSINARQKEIYNFQKISGVLADFGFATYRLTDDWNGADFLAVNFDGVTSLKVQLKGRLSFGKKYQGKDLWICFRYQGKVYLYPHDELLGQALELTTIENTVSWREAGGYDFPAPPQELLHLLDENYCLGPG